MYGMTATVVPGSVYFDAPALMRLNIVVARELTCLEIEFVSGGAKFTEMSWREIGHNVWVTGFTALGGGFGGLAGSTLGPAGTVGGGVAGAVGGAVLGEVSFHYFFD